MKILRITSKVDGFRRAGLSHPAVAADHPAESLTDEQIEALKAEPMLVVEELDVPDEGEGGKKAPSSRKGGGTEKPPAQ